MDRGWLLRLQSCEQLSGVDHISLELEAKIDMESVINGVAEQFAAAASEARHVCQKGELTHSNWTRRNEFESTTYSVVAVTCVVDYSLLKGPIQHLRGFWTSNGELMDFQGPEEKFKARSTKRWRRRSMSVTEKNHWLLRRRGESYRTLLIRQSKAAEVMKKLIEKGLLLRLV